MKITLYNLTEAVRATLAAVTAVSRATANETLTEGIVDYPLVQVYPESGEASRASRTDRTTFGGGLRQHIARLNVDVYVQQRAHIGEDMAAVATVADAIIAKFEQQQNHPLFGAEGIEAFRWTWERVTFVYGDPETRFAGIRFRLEFTVF